MSAFIQGQPDVLEIGPFDNPTFRPDMGDSVRYLDFFSAEELKAAHGRNPNRNMSRVVDIDYVVKNNEIAKAVNAEFDLAVGNHLFEHLPNPIYWLGQISQLLRTGGHVFLAIPDRRVTFDYFRPVSVAADMIQAFEERRDKPTKWQILNGLYYHNRVDAEKIYSGNLPAHFKPRFSYSEAMRMAEVRSKEYFDTHCWVFTCESFVQIIENLHSAEYINFHLKRAFLPEKMNEFWVILQKS